TRAIGNTSSKPSRAVFRGANASTSAGTETTRVWNTRAEAWEADETVLSYEPMFLVVIARVAYDAFAQLTFGHIGRIVCLFDRRSKKAEARSCVKHEPANRDTVSYKIHGSAAGTCA